MCWGDSLCSRSGDVIEPLLKPQWWVRTQESATASAQAVRDGKLRIIPEEHAKIWFQWLVRA